ncbi:MAG TPA: PAS domain-containing sensor histidine kinase, partial [Spirochaetes bacterium]|nr:PAS domain-containing sensor histidine kinase [Spirochaetota bacterium]
MKKNELQAAFNAVFSNSFQAILRLDAEYTILDYNPAAAEWIKKVYGKKVGAGDSFLEYLPGEDVEEFNENIKRTIGEEHPHYKLFSIIGGKDQTEYWTEYQFYPVIIASVFTGMYVFIFDITERKNVIDEVARSTRRFYSLIKNSSDIVSVIDADGFIRFTSNSVEKILGYLPAEITGKNFMEYIFPADLENFKTAFSGSMSADRKSFVSQFRFLHREGYWVFLESLGSNHLGDETVRGVILNSRDVTDRRHFEEMLKKISRQNELILESAGEGIYGMNREGRITFANPAAAEMMGFKVEEIIGKNHTEIVKQVTAEGVPCPVEECRYYTSMLDGNTCSVDDAFFTRSDGGFYPVEYISTPIKEKGEIVGAVVTFNDISERKRNEEELLKAKEEADAANRAKSEFLANMSHEIRTPIHNILGFLEMLDSTELDRTQREYVGISRESTRTLLEIISDILDYSKIEKGKVEIEVSDFNPRVLFESTVELFSATAAERNLSLYAFIDPGLPDLLVGDSLRIRQVLNNLIGNAMKFTPRQGEVAIDIVMEERTAKGCRVSFSVLDTGIGVPLEK